MIFQIPGEGAKAPHCNEDSAIAGACRQQSKFVTLKAKTKGELSKPLFDENCLQFLYVKIDKLQSKGKSKQDFQFLVKTLWIKLRNSYFLVHSNAICNPILYFDHELICFLLHILICFCYLFYLKNNLIV